MLQSLFSLCQFKLTKWSFSVHSTTHNAPYIHLSHDLILELWQTFPMKLLLVINNHSYHMAYLHVHNSYRIHSTDVLHLVHSIYTGQHENILLAFYHHTYTHLQQRTFLLIYHITYMLSIARCLQLSQSIHILPFFVYRKYNVFGNTKGLDDAVQIHKIVCLTSNFSADCIKMHATVTF